MLLKACLNGSRRPGEHPLLPLTPEEAAADAVAVRAAGAGAVHVHPRDSGGRESLAAEDVGAVVAAVRAASPGLPVGVSTGLWITGGDVVRRREAVGAWARLPEDARPGFASVNLSEPGFHDLARTLLEAGVAVEAGVWSPEDAVALAESGLADRVLRILVEVIDPPPDEALPRAAAILHKLDDLALPGERLLHGEGTATWPLIAEAARLGLATRIGLEDTLLTPDGRRAPGNAGLVRLAMAAGGRGR
ncbi:3-keto-5-aminohexanoate cleavage protein [Sphaerisporangium sp. TRM90804]|uniref:3-keto-5-aminohexanoate cleavage protein n=1 Tax=Sphaerisporangium sp. TRM90804 TaxID=3031113 RepID=UPI00244741C9|nr:3-keto-5-aminohexanoate cleavage protein [Sphaerisporangium sp. TRM90804]MDH2427684.1 3-keto-5-aminohexanoate cleavage protein [Sphaerisporangium sp. TRM90804]